MTSFEEFEKFYSSEKFSTKIYHAALNKKLPDVLNWNEASELWASTLDRNDFLTIKNRRLKWILEAVSNDELQTHSIDCGTINQGINKYEFKAWLTQKDLWPIDNCLLSLWWNEEAKVIGDYAENQHVAMNASTHIFSTPPKKKDDWYHAMKTTVDLMHVENDEWPSSTEVWLRLCKNPPCQYPVEFKENKLMMEGVKKPLDIENFKKRWGNYTK